VNKQLVNLRGVEIGGRILDIGGGGEGVISRHAGKGVIAIDKLKEELEESPDVGIKIVMDATDMKFLDNTFDNATCFYSLMFMSNSTVEKCLAETYRVLKPGGRLWIWDATMPLQAAEEVFAVQLSIALADEEISTGYGIGWNRGQSLDSICAICAKIGFKQIKSESDGAKIFLQLQKRSD